MKTQYCYRLYRKAMRKIKLRSKGRGIGKGDIYDLHAGHSQRRKLIISTCPEVSFTLLMFCIPIGLKL